MILTKIIVAILAAYGFYIILGLIGGIGKGAGQNSLDAIRNIKDSK